MAKPIANYHPPELTEEERNRQALDQLVQEIAQNAGGLQETVRILQEMHKIGVLGAANAALQAKKQIADILIEQVTKPTVTNMINHAMGVFEVLGQMKPASTQKLLQGLNKGIEKATEALEQQEKTGVLDIFKALKDPDINRTVTFGLKLLKGFGEGLKE